MTCAAYSADHKHLFQSLCIRNGSSIDCDVMDRRDRKLLDSIEHPVFVLEPGAVGQPRYVAFNRFACAATGCVESDILGLTADQIYPGPVGMIVFSYHARALATGEMLAYEVSLPFQEGERLARTTLTPMRDELGRVARIVGSTVYVSGRDVLASHGGHDTSLEEMQDFIHLAAHDLRAPMRNIRAIADMLRSELPEAGEATLGLLDMLEEVSATTGDLIGQILSHAGAMTARPETTAFELETVVADILTILDPVGKCEAMVQTGELRTDRNAVQIILTNLIDNAIKHASPAAGPLRLEFAHRLEPDGAVSISVSDNGQGFSDPTLLLLDGGQLRSDAGFGIFGNIERPLERIEPEFPS